MIKRPISKGDSERKAPASRRQKTKTNDNSILSERGATKRTDVRTAPKFRKNTSKIGTEDYSAQGVRINKYLADAGLGSRRRVEELIVEGVVKVNRKVVTDLSVRIMPGDFVTAMGEPVSDRKIFTYILLNKPKDTITTVSDELGRATVMDIVRKEARIYPVGRLDRNTTGALILTNDGELAYRLTHPKYEVPRVYNVVLDVPLDLRDAAAISRGVELEDGITGECEVSVNPEDRRKVALGIREGRNREVRRIFESLGYEVQRLDRKSFATLTTRGLARGEYRNLTQKEILELKKLVGLHTKYETVRKKKSRYE